MNRRGGFLNRVLQHRTRKWRPLLSPSEGMEAEGPVRQRGFSVVIAPPDPYLSDMSSHSPDRDALQALLDFHVEAGVDLALDETPHDRFAEGAAPPAPARAAE